MSTERYFIELRINKYMKFDDLINSILKESTEKRDRCLKKADEVYGKKTS
jgi:hypothetical protein